MTTREDLVHLVAQTPNSDVARFMLTDFLVEVEDRTHTEATDLVEDVVRTALVALELARAVRVYISHHPGRAYLYRVLATMYELPDDHTFTLMIVPGTGVPVRAWGWSAKESEWFGESVLTVPARWLLDMVERFDRSRSKADSK